ncbi:MAG TPA: lipoyl domain-containing protein [Planctomycetaceae bacterium]|nr:lipoyl domain-containing protein [Planctomycetaceae bacterium]
MTPLTAPDVGASDLRVSVWLIEVGDRAEQGERVVELLTPGMTFDVAMPIAGRITAIEKPIGAAVQAGDVLAWIEPDP